jgi:hypothetical protein
VIFTRHAVEHLIIHLSAAPGEKKKVGKPTERHEGYLEVSVTLEHPTIAAPAPGVPKRYPRCGRGPL